MADPRVIRAALLQKQRRRQAREALEATLKEAAPQAVDVSSVLHGLYPKQASAVLDPGKLIAVLGTRRSGKSRGFIRRLVHTALTIPDSYQIYVNTSWPECRRIAWRGNRNQDGLVPLNRLFKLGGVPNKNDHTITYPNGSVVELIGADNVAQIERALGTAPQTVWIDESQKMPHLDYLIKDVLGPAMADFDGTIILTGTPSVDCSGLFFDITYDDDGRAPNPDLVGPDKWHLHKMNVVDNPFFGATKEERFERAVVSYCKKFHLKLDDPEVQRSWFGRWMLVDSNFVYHVHRLTEDELCYAPVRYMPGCEPRLDTMEGGIVDLRACLRDLPLRDETTGQPHDWCFGLGSDLGYEPDPFAWVLWAWTWERPTLYEVASWKEIRLTTDQQAAEIQMIQHNAPLSFAEVDAGGGGKGIARGWAEGWMDRYPLPVEEAEKAHKVTFIEFFNNDLRAGNIKLRRGGPLYEEMKRLTWAPRTGNMHRREDVRRDKQGKKQRPNDCCDAALYAHRKAQHFRFTPTEKEPAYGSKEYWEREEQKLEDGILGVIAPSRLH